MNIHEFIAIQGAFSDKHAGAGRQSNLLLEKAFQIVEAIGNLEENLTETFDPSAPLNMAYAWLSLALLALDGARRMGLTPDQIDEALVMLTDEFQKDQNV